VTARLEYERRYLALTPLDYENGDPIQADVGVGDAKWLDAKVEASDGSTSWVRVNPCFSDSELHDLVRWLRALGSGDSGDASFQGVEPSLLFKAIWGVGRVRLSAMFNLELHPDGRHNYDENDPKVVTFDVPRSVMDRFADSIESDLSRFPDRGSGP
jgi:hypothetical protein